MEAASLPKVENVEHKKMYKDIIEQLSFKNMKSFMPMPSWVSF
jgi:hypothetical protein